MNLRARIGIAVVCVLTLVVGVILFFTLSSPRSRTGVVVATPAKLSGDEKKLRAELDERVVAARAKGEPVVITDLKPKPVAPADDAATPLLAAIAFMDRKEFNADKVWDLDISLQLPDAQWQQVDAALAKYQPALDLIDQADGRTAADWKIEFKSPGLMILLRHLNGARQLANLLQMSALSAHRAGRDDVAIHRMTQIVTLAQRVDEGTPFLVGHLVGCGIASLGVATIQEVAPTLTVPPPSRNELAALVRLLLDEKIIPTGLLRAALAERVGTLDTMACLIDGRLTLRDLEGVTAGRQTSAPVPPAPATVDLLADEIAMFDHSTLEIVASGAPRLPDFRKQHPNSIPVGRTPVIKNLVSAYDRAALSHYQTVLRLRLAAAALVVRAYALEHDGAMPPSLDTLVPRYLAAVPADPMLPAPATIQFRAAPAPLVFSTAVDERKRRATTTKPSASAAPDFALPLTPAK
jgi:hypothetical protein